MDFFKPFYKSPRHGYDFVANGISYGLYKVISPWWSHQ